MKISSVLLASVGLSLAACSSGAGDFVVGGPVAPPEKPLYQPFVPDEKAMDDFILAAGSNTVLFDTDRSFLDVSARATLDRQIAWLMTHPEAEIVVEGHADRRATDGYNLRLGLRRAEAVVEYMISKGISKERLTAKSYGEGKPIIDKKGDVFLNRRAVTVVIVDGVSSGDDRQNLGY